MSSAAKGYDALLKSAEEGPTSPWRAVGFAPTLAGIGDEASSWSGPRLYGGDMVRFVSRSTGEERSMYVFDPRASSLARVPPVRGIRPHIVSSMNAEQLTWASVWESPRTSAARIASACGGLPSTSLATRLAVAACECAAQAIAIVGSNEKGLRSAIADFIDYAITKRHSEAMRRSRQLVFATHRAEGMAPDERLAARAVNAAGACVYSQTPDDRNAKDVFSAYLEAATLSDSASALPQRRGEPFLDHENGVVRSIREAHAAAITDLLRFRLPLASAVSAACGLDDPLPTRFDEPNPFVYLRRSAP